MIIEFYLRHEFAFAAAQLSLAMLGMGATLRPADFLELVQKPKPVGVGLSLQLIGVPILAWLFILLFQPTASVVIAIAMCAAIPGGTLSNIFTYLGRGHVPLSITLTAIATFACLLTTPLVLEWLIAEHIPDGFVMPAARIAGEIFVFLLLPLGSGMLFLKLFAKQAETLSKWAIRGSLSIVAFIVIASIMAGRLDLASFGAENTALIIGFCFLLAITSHWIPRLIGIGHKETLAINVEVTLRNINLGLLLKASLFTTAQAYSEQVSNDILMGLLLFGGVSLFTGMGIAGFSRMSRRDQTDSAATASSS